MLDDRPLVLFGAGEMAKRFYKEYSELYTILYCISNNEKEKAFVVDDKEICEVHRVNEYFHNTNELIVVCAADTQEMLEQLRIMGLSYGRDYIDAKMFGALYTKKKLAIFYGICYVRAICECLNENIHFKNEYTALHWVSYRSLDVREEQLFQYLLGKCDLYVCNGYFTEKQNIRSEWLMGRLNKMCRVIRIPLIDCRAYYPCDKKYRNNGYHYAVISNHSPYMTFVWQDYLINEMIHEGRDVEDIISVVKDEGLYSHDYVVENYKKELRKIEFAESAADIKITDYLYQNHGRKRLFLDGQHISNDVIYEMSQRLLTLLGIRGDDNGTIPERRLLFTSEVPVYPSVIKHLNLNIYDGKSKLYTNRGDIEVDFEDYIRLYYEYCTKMKWCKEKGIYS